MYKRQVVTLFSELTLKMVRYFDQRSNPKGVILIPSPDNFADIFQTTCNHTFGGILGYINLSISIKRIVCLCLCLSVCLNAFAQFSRYRVETLQVGLGRPGTGRGGVKHFGGAPGWGWGST